MPEFVIAVPELHYSHRRVTADSIEEAFAKVNSGEEDVEEKCEFSRTFDSDEHAYDGRPAGADFPTHRYVFGEVRVIP